MGRTSWIAVALLAFASVSQLGCRACQNCYDYAPPVAGAPCGGTDGCRAGSCVGDVVTHEPPVQMAPVEMAPAPMVVN